MMGNLDLRIKVMAREGKVFIPRFVGAGLYGSKEDPPSNEFLDGHEFVIRGCLKHPFFIEQVFRPNGNIWESFETCIKLVVLGEGKVVRLVKKAFNLGEIIGFQVLFYVPVNDCNGRPLGFCEVRNVKYLFSRLQRVYPGIKLVEDL